MPWPDCLFRMPMFSVNGCWNPLLMRAKPSCWHRLPVFMEPRVWADQEVRLAYVLNQESIDAAMDCLQAALIAYPEKYQYKSQA